MGTRVGDGLIDELVELGAVDYFDKRSALAVGGDYPDGGGVLDADALAEGVVGFDFGGKLALRIDGEGNGNALAFGEFVGEVVEDVEAGDGGLIVEDGVAVFVAEGFAFQVKPAGVHGGLKAPGVEGEREVVTDPGDFVLGGGLLEQGVGVGAVGAFHVFEFNDGHAGAGGRAQG